MTKNPEGTTKTDHFKPTTAESQAAGKKAEIKFRWRPEVVEPVCESGRENTSRDETNERCSGGILKKHIAKTQRIATTNR